MRGSIVDYKTTCVFCKYFELNDDSSFLRIQILYFFGFYKSFLTSLFCSCSTFCFLKLNGTDCNFNAQNSLFFRSCESFLGSLFCGCSKSRSFILVNSERFFCIRVQQMKTIMYSITLVHGFLEVEKKSKSN